MNKPVLVHPYRSLHLRDVHAPEQKRRLDLFALTGDEDVRELAEQVYEDIFLPWLRESSPTPGGFASWGTVPELCAKLGLTTRSAQQKRVMRAVVRCARTWVCLSLASPEGRQEVWFAGLFAWAWTKKAEESEVTLRVCMSPELEENLRLYEGLEEKCFLARGLKLF